MQYFKGRELIKSIPQYGVGHPPHPQLHAWWLANSKPLLGKAQPPLIHFLLYIRLSQMALTIAL